MQKEGASDREKLSAPHPTANPHHNHPSAGDIGDEPDWWGPMWITRCSPLKFTAGVGLVKRVVVRQPGVVDPFVLVMRPARVEIVEEWSSRATQKSFLIPSHLPAPAHTAHWETSSTEV